MGKSTKVKRVDMQKNAELREENTAESRLAKVVAADNRQKSFSKITDAVAQSDLWMRNEPIPFAKELWPHDFRFQYADLYYPNARGGAIYIDTPGAPYEVTQCKIKHEKLHAKGVRYTYLGPNEGEAEMLARLPLERGEPQRKENMI